MEKKSPWNGDGWVEDKMGKDAAPEGALVLQEVAQLTGFSSEYVDSEITQLLGMANESVNTMTLDQLRLVMMNYLETINDEMTRAEEKHLL